MIPASNFVGHLPSPYPPLLRARSERQWLDVERDFGAVGDGIADDTEALQAALNASTINRPRKILLGGGIYRITSALSAPFAPATQLIGAGRGVSQILQATAGQPVLRFSYEDTHSWYVSDLSMAYATPQTNPGSVAVEYHKPGGTGNGWYHHNYARLQINNAFRGFALADDDGQQTIWNSSWHHIVMSNVTDRAFSFAPAVAIGMPQLRLDTIGIYNSAPTTSAAVYTIAAEILAFGLDIEGWTNEALWLTGGTPATIIGLHIEHHKFTNPSSRLGYFANGQSRISDFGIAATSLAGNTDQLTLFHADVDALLTLQGGAGSVAFSPGNPPVKQLFATGSGGKVVLRDVSVPGLTVPAASDGFFGAALTTRPTVTGSRGSNAALASLLSQLAALGLVTDSTT